MILTVKMRTGNDTQLCPERSRPHHANSGTQGMKEGEEQQGYDGACHGMGQIIDLLYAKKEVGQRSPSASPSHGYLQVQWQEQSLPLCAEKVHPRKR